MKSRFVCVRPACGPRKEPITWSGPRREGAISIFRWTCWLREDSSFVRNECEKDNQCISLANMSVFQSTDLLTRGVGCDRGGARQPQAIRCDNGPELTSQHFLA